MLALVVATSEAVRDPAIGTMPVVGSLGPDLFRDGDVVELDGGLGRVDLPDVTEVRVVTSLIERDDGRILLLRRSNKVGSFQGAWAGVSGFLEDPTAEGQAVREIVEETGITATQLRLAATGRAVLARDRDRIFAVRPFRFRVERPVVQLDWEHTEYEWVEPSEIARRPTVPKLMEVWNSVRPAAEERDRLGAPSGKT